VAINLVLITNMVAITLFFVCFLEDSKRNVIPWGRNVSYSNSTCKIVTGERNVILNSLESMFLEEVWEGVELEIFFKAANWLISRVCKRHITDVSEMIEVSYSSIFLNFKWMYFFIFLPPNLTKPFRKHMAVTCNLEQWEFQTSNFLLL
jgi:hypothetical protein